MTLEQFEQNIEFSTQSSWDEKKETTTVRSFKIWYNPTGEEILCFPGLCFKCTKVKE